MLHFTKLIKSNYISSLVCLTFGWYILTDDEVVDLHYILLHDNMAFCGQFYTFISAQGKYGQWRILLNGSVNWISQIERHNKLNPSK